MRLLLPGFGCVGINESRNAASWLQSLSSLQPPGPPETSPAPAGEATEPYTPVPGEGICLTLLEASGVGNTGLRRPATSPSRSGAAAPVPPPPSRAPPPTAPLAPAAAAGRNPLAHLDQGRLGHQQGTTRKHRLPCGQGRDLAAHLLAGAVWECRHRPEGPTCHVTVHRQGRTFLGERRTGRAPGLQTPRGKNKTSPEKQAEARAPCHVARLHGHQVHRPSALQ